MREKLPQGKISVLQATAINMIDMVGIGPFVVLSFIVQQLNNNFLYAWIAGALLAMVDAMIWSELGSTFPLAGGSYNFLKEGFGPKTGKLMSFLFVWQTMIQAPLVIASAAIGFSQYLAFIVQLNSTSSKIVSAVVIILIVFLLYRKIEDIGKISVLLWLGVIITMTCIIGGGLWNGNFAAPVKHMNDNLEINSTFFAALGIASVKSIYSYLGYYNVCHLGGEIANPQKNIPRSMFISVIGITILYLLMNISIASALPIEKIKNSPFVASDFIKTLAGSSAAVVVTCLILWVAFASAFSATLGYSRIPYAAAKDGAFFKIFARLHPSKKFPYISLLFLGAVAIIFSLTLDIKHIITAILAMRILLQFAAQAVGLLLLNKKNGRNFFAWKMPLFPIPVIVAILVWLAIFYSTGVSMMLYAAYVIGAGIIVYSIKAYINKEWPFKN